MSNIDNISEKTLINSENIIEKPKRKVGSGNYIMTPLRMEQLKNAREKAYQLRAEINKNKPVKIKEKKKTKLELELENLKLKNSNNNKLVFHGSQNRQIVEEKLSNSRHKPGTICKAKFGRFRNTLFLLTPSSKITSKLPEAAIIYCSNS